MVIKKGGQNETDEKLLQAAGVIQDILDIPLVKKPAQIKTDPYQELGGALIYYGYNFSDTTLSMLHLSYFPEGLSPLPSSDIDMSWLLSNDNKELEESKIGTYLVSIRI